MSLLSMCLQTTAETIDGSLKTIPNRDEKPTFLKVNWRNTPKDHELNTHQKPRVAHSAPSLPVWLSYAQAHTELVRVKEQIVGLSMKDVWGFLSDGEKAQVVFSCFPFSFTTPADGWPLQELKREEQLRHRSREAFQAQQARETLERWGWVDSSKRPWV